MSLAPTALTRESVCPHNVLFLEGYVGQHRIYVHFIRNKANQVAAAQSILSNNSEHIVVAHPPQASNVLVLYTILWKQTKKLFTLNANIGTTLIYIFFNTISFVLCPDENWTPHRDESLITDIHYCTWFNCHKCVFSRATFSWDLIV